MKDDELYYYEEREENSQDYLTRITYIRNFDAPKKLKTDETNILRSTMEDTLEGTKDSRVGSSRASSEKK